MAKHCGKVQIDPLVLAERLALPASISIRNAVMDHDHGMIVLTLEGEPLPIVEPGHEIPMLQPIVHRERVRWEFILPTPTTFCEIAIGTRTETPVAKRHCSACDRPDVCDQMAPRAAPCGQNQGSEA